MDLAGAVDRERLLHTFLELVAVDSPTGHEEAVGELLERRFADLGCTVTRDQVGNLVAVLPGTREGTILVATHMDTAGTDRGIVPVVGPDGVVRTDGSTILGADDKSGIAGCLELLTVLRQTPGVLHPTLELLVTVGEESGLVGSRALDVSRLQATHGFVLDTAGAMGSITYWSPTSVYLTITFHGRKAHAGVEPEKGVSAVRAAAQGVAAMPLGRIDSETVANIGTVHGGEARNVVPDTVVLEGMARSHDQGKLDRQLDAMRRACQEAADATGATVDVVADEIYRTYRIEEDARPYREAARAIASVGLPVTPRKSGGGTDGNLLNAKGIPCVALPTGMVDEHATSEHIAIDDMVLAAQVLVVIATQDPDPRDVR
ncbi:M20/M25/M40 family metallo-hydrolase [Cellulomonas soli]|uniref:M20/M25/M40 family metallo-hydrolase n=1 Tax=Cellulomonas soli TaxID=931535 RepID=UPI003F86D309